MGYSGNDTYLFNRGDGHDVINDYSGGYATTDKIVFGAGILIDDIAIQKQDGNLIVHVKDPANPNYVDSITIENAIANSAQYSIEIFEFADGSTYNAGALMATAATLVQGTDGDDVLHGETGNDVLFGGDGNDTYVVNSGDNQVEINAYDSSNQITDTALFEDANISELWFSREDDNLLVNIVGSDDQVVFSDWYDGAQHQVEKIETSSSVLLNNQIEQLVLAMSAYDVPSGVGSVVPEDELRDSGQRNSPWADSASIR